MCTVAVFLAKDYLSEPSGRAIAARAKEIAAKPAFICTAVVAICVGYGVCRRRDIATAMLHAAHLRAAARR